MWAANQVYFTITVPHLLLALDRTPDKTTILKTQKKHSEEYFYTYNGRSMGPKTTLEQHQLHCMDQRIMKTFFISLSSHF